MNHNTAWRGVAAAAFALAASLAHAATYAYVSNGDSRDISVFGVDTSSGALRAIETVPVDGTVMPMALSPDHHRLYAALRSTPYRVVGFAINPLGRARRQRLAARPTRHPQAPQPVR